jgi:hypothetical protein
LVYRVAGKMSSNNIKCNTTLKAKNSVPAYKWACYSWLGGAMGKDLENNC